MIEGRKCARELLWFEVDQTQHDARGFLTKKALQHEVRIGILFRGQLILEHGIIERGKLLQLVSFNPGPNLANAICRHGERCYDTWSTSFFLRGWESLGRNGGGGNGIYVPKLFIPPLRAQCRSLWCVSLELTVVPLAKTTFFCFNLVRIGNWREFEMFVYVKDLPQN